MVATVLFSSCSSTSTLPGTSTVNWNDWPGLASIVEGVLGVGVHVQLVGGVAVDPDDDRLVDLGLQLRVGRRDLPPLIVTSTTSRSGGACWSVMSDGLTVDADGLADVALRDLRLSDPPQPAVSSAAACGKVVRIRCLLSRGPILVRRACVLTVRRDRLPAPVPHRDVDDHARHHDRRRERGNRKQQRVVGED